MVVSNTNILVHIGAHQFFGGDYLIVKFRESISIEETINESFDLIFLFPLS